jgi:hypothetical protein
MQLFDLFDGNEKRCSRAIFPLALAFLCSAAATAQAAAPDSPEVRAMIEKGLKYLENADDERLGGKCLIGLSFHKAGRPANHPKILEAIHACESSASMLGGDGSQLDNYSTGLALVFLLEVDPQRQRSLAYRYLQELLHRQRSAGAWGYAGSPTGDTSQTQYPTLGLWLATKSGIDVPMDAVLRDCTWLLRTQDPSGAWGYQGNDPGNYRRVKQSEIRPALVAAGLVSLYLCADMLRVGDTSPKEEKAELPSALKKVGDPLDIKPQATMPHVDTRVVRQALADGNTWFRTRYTIESEGHTHYFIYALERYHAFRESFEKSSEVNPRWYNDMVQYLKKTQHENGSWEGLDGNSVCTSFAVLALLRSAKKTIATVVARLGEGVLLGGRGLPKNTADLQEREGKIVESQLTGSIDELLTTIEKGNTPELQRLTESQARWKLDNDVVKRSGEITRLRAVVAAGSFESRLLAVRALGRVRELDNVPVLIYALSDPDMRVVLEADKGLRFVSRKLDGVGLPDDPKPEQVRAAIAAWKTWYQSLRPNAEFLD